MLSVIVPTMWYYPPFLQLLENILDLDCIGEVIIINNNCDETPEHSALNHHKILMHRSNENLYVSPSWNLGARLAKFDHLCFLSDDVDVNIDIFKKTDQFLNNDNVGMVATLVEEEASKEIYTKLLVDNTINYIRHDEPDDSLRAPPIGIGVIFFIKKSDWKPVPEEIKIFHGEVIHWCRISTKKTNYIITNCYIYTPHHVSWERLAQHNNETFNKIQMSDCRLIQQLMTKINNNQEIEL